MKFPTSLLRYFTLNRFKSFGRNDAANVSIIIGVMAVPLFAVSGISLDYGLAVRSKHRYDSAALRGAAAAVNSARNYLLATNSGSNETALPQARAEATRLAILQFKSGLTGSALASLDADPTVTLTIEKNTISASLSYAATQTTTFARVMGKDTLLITGEARSAAAFTRAAPNNKKIEESFETPPSPFVGDDFGVYTTYNGWSVLGAGIEIGKGVRYQALSAAHGTNVAELDSHNNSSISKNVFLSTGAYELRYFYYSRIPTESLRPVNVCGSFDADVSWAPTTNRVSVYFDRGPAATLPARYWDASLGRNRFDPSTNNLIDACTNANPTSRMIERSVMINITKADNYWLTFQGEGTSDTLGALIDYIQLCVNSCSPAAVPDYFPWNNNTLLFRDRFDSPPDATLGTPGQFSPGFYNSTLAVSGEISSGWSASQQGWSVTPTNQVLFYDQAGAPTTNWAIGLGWSTQGRTMSRMFLLPPGYYSVSYYYRTAPFGGPAGVSCSLTSGAPLTSKTVRLFVDSDRSFASPGPTTTWNATASWFNPDGSAANGTFAKLPSQAVDRCDASDIWTRRTVNMKITKAGYYWLSFQWGGASSTTEGMIADVSLTALGGLTSMAPANAVQVAAPGAAVGSSQVRDGFTFIAN